MVEGFAPEVAWVTARRQRPAGGAPCVSAPPPRRCSATIISHVLHSYRDLPMLYNQWCSVVRWEKPTRPFLRTRGVLVAGGPYHPRDRRGGQGRD